MADNPSQQLLDMWKRQVEERHAGLAAHDGPGAGRGAHPHDRDGPTGLLAAVHGSGHGRLVEGHDAGGGALAGSDGPVESSFLDQWIAAWSRVLEQAMSTDTFAQLRGKQLEGFLNVSAPIKKAAEATGRRLAGRPRHSLARPGHRARPTRGAGRGEDRRARGQAGPDHSAG